MKKQDFILAGVLLLFCVLFYFTYLFFFHEEGKMVSVEVNGKEYGAYSLMQEQEIPIVLEDGKTDLLKISDGKAKMISADCPDKLCTHQSAVSRTGQTIVCLPLKIVVEVKSDEEPKIDAVVQ